MGSANEYWHYARQCADLAARTADEAHRQFMLSMAETWRRLATGEIVSAPQNDGPLTAPTAHASGATVTDKPAS